MPQPRSTNRRWPVLLLALAAAGCSSTIESHGYQLDQRRVELIQPGVTSREEVAGLLGSPSALATFDDRNWYYISQRYDRTNFFYEELVAQDVLVVAFDDRGLVQSVETRDMQMAEAIVPDPDETRTLGNELTLLEQFLGNIGRFNTDAPPPGGGFRRGGPASRPPGF